MPNFFALFNSEKYAAWKEEYMLSENELYCTPVFLGGDDSRYGWLVREDIMNELNLEVPTDWDSFVAVLKTMKAAYPDSYPFTMRSMTSSISGFVELLPQFGVKYTTGGIVLDNETGEYYDCTTTNAMREALKKIRYLMEELMDVACLSYTSS